MTQALLKEATPSPATTYPQLDVQAVVRPRALDQFLHSRADSGKRVQVRTSPWRTSAVLVASDLAALLGAMSIAGWLQPLIFDEAGLSHQLYSSPLPWLFLVVYACAGLYPGIPLSPPDELRRITMTSTTVYLSATVAAWLITGLLDTTWWTVLGISWVFSLVMVPLMRDAVRQIASSRPWWGYSAVVVGSGPVTESVLHTLVNHPKIGIKPIAVIGDSPVHPSSIAGVPIIGPISRIREFVQEYRFSYAIVPMSEMADHRTSRLIRRLSRLFKCVMVIPPITHFSSLWVSPVDLGGFLGLESRCRLLDPGRQALKRVLDLLLIALGTPLWLPCMAIIAITIKLESAGPVFFTQSRPGLGGKDFRVFKFHTMVDGSHDALKSYLDQAPEHRQEWAQTGKLRNDLRVTHVGRFLRRTSLDELPQLWNVVRGDMSLVGPRPILHEQRDQYRAGWPLYIRVRPGITGAWQISGRNTLTMAQRIQLDTYYVRNWSIWLDIYYLSRTAWTVLQARGAY